MTTMLNQKSPIISSHHAFSSNNQVYGSTSLIQSCDVFLHPFIKSGPSKTFPPCLPAGMLLSSTFNGCFDILYWYFRLNNQTVLSPILWLSLKFLTAAALLLSATYFPIWARSSAVTIVVYFLLRLSAVSFSKVAATAFHFSNHTLW